MQALQAASRWIPTNLIATKNGACSSRIIQQQIHRVVQTRLMTTATATTTAGISISSSSRMYLFAPFVSFIVFQAMFLVASQDLDVTSTWRRHHRYQIVLNKPWQNNKPFTV